MIEFLTPLLPVILSAAIISYALTEIIKAFLKAYLNSTPENDNEPWFFNSSLRLLAIILGAFVGLAFDVTTLSIMTGACAGAMNTMIYALIRKRIRQSQE